MLPTLNLAEYERALRPRVPRRPRQRDCQFEPAYPGEETVVFALGDPDKVVHGFMGRCVVTWPHPISGCAEFKMTDRDVYAEQHRWEDVP
jgi:hypothetical protein